MRSSDYLKKLIHEIEEGIKKDMAENQKIRDALAEAQNNGHKLQKVEVVLVINWGLNSVLNTGAAPAIVGLLLTV